MPAELVYYPAESGAQMTADALRLMLKQSGMPCRLAGEGDEVEIVFDGDDPVLLLTLEGGFVSGIVVDVTVVNDPKARRVCQLLESIGWLAADET